MGRPRKIDPLELAELIAPHLNKGNRRIARELGLSEPTVRRAKASMDNLEHRRLFTLPERQPGKHLAPPSAPPRPARGGGDPELAAAMWLSDCAATGSPELFAEAKRQWARSFPGDTARELERRLAERLSDEAGHSFAGIGAFGRFDLDERFNQAVERRSKHEEIIQRFGELEQVFMPQPPETLIEADTPAEREALDQYADRPDRDAGIPAAVLALIRQLPEPRTLADVIHEQEYWAALYRLRSSMDSREGDYTPEVSVRIDYLKGLMFEIKPRSRAEAARAFQYLVEDGGLDLQDTKKLLGAVDHLFLGTEN